MAFLVARLVLVQLVEARSRARGILLNPPVALLDTEAGRAAGRPLGPLAHHAAATRLGFGIIARPPRPPVSALLSAVRIRPRQGTRQGEEHKRLHLSSLDRAESLNLEILQGHCVATNTNGDVY